MYDLNKLNKQATTSTSETPAPATTSEATASATTETAEATPSETSASTATIDTETPASTTTSETSETSSTSEAPATSEAAPATTSAFSGDYLSNGYYANAENGAKYLKKEYIGEYAREIAAGLSGMKPLEFEKMVRELKRNKKRTLPYEARQTAVAEMLPVAKNLVRHKKAPAMLVEFIQRNLEEIRDDETWTAFYRHCQAISGYME